VIRIPHYLIEECEAAEDRRIVQDLALIEQRLGQPVDGSTTVDDFTLDALINCLSHGWSVDECVDKLRKKT
jgi:hypothetical protein